MTYKVESLVVASLLQRVISTQAKKDDVVHMKDKASNTLFTKNAVNNVQETLRDILPSREQLWSSFKSDFLKL